MAAATKSNVPEGLCQCGCGQTTSISRWNVPSRGYVAGKPRRFIQGHDLRVIRNPSAMGKKWAIDPEIQAHVDSLDETIIAWLAGVIDGEGSIYFVRGAQSKGEQWYARVVIYGTDLNFMEAIAERVGLGRRSGPRERGSKWKPSYTYWFNATQCRSLIPRLLPWLVVKRNQSQILLEVLEGKRDRKQAVVQLRKLNKKGL